VRLKEDSTSWRSSGIIKRDARHGGAVDGIISRGGVRKDTWKWCKGIVGREHVWEREVTRPGRTATSSSLSQMVCQSCGKQDYRTALWNGLPFEQYFSHRYPEANWNGESQAQTQA
jgi:hypothetical protein